MRRKLKSKYLRFETHVSAEKGIVAHCFVSGIMNRMKK